MAIREQDVIRLPVPDMTRTEAVYIPNIIKGFGTTVRHFFTSFGQSKFSPVKTSRTMQYPEERREHLVEPQAQPQHADPARHARRIEQELATCRRRRLARSSRSGSVGNV